MKSRPTKLFRAEKRNKHARLLVARQASTLKKGGSFLDGGNKKFTNFNVIDEKLMYFSLKRQYPFPNFLDKTKLK